MMHKITKLRSSIPSRIGQSLKKNATSLALSATLFCLTSPSRAQSETLPQKAFAFMITYCAACHGAGSEAAGGFGVADNLQAMVQQNFVIPGSPETSPVYYRVANESMPLPGSPKPNQTAINNLRNWILAGAQPN